MAWQDMDTAPEDKEVLVIQRKQRYVAHYVPESQFGPVWATPDGYCILSPEKWHELPGLPN